MVLWWIGNAVFVLVVIPVVVMLLNQVMRPAVEIGKYADDVVEHIQPLVSHLSGAEQLVRTRELVREVGSGVQRYGNALDQTLSR